MLFLSMLASRSIEEFDLKVNPQSIRKNPKKWHGVPFYAKTMLL